MAAARETQLMNARKPIGSHLISSDGLLNVRQSRGKRLLVHFSQSSHRCVGVDACLPHEDWEKMLRDYHSVLDRAKMPNLNVKCPAKSQLNNIVDTKNA